MQYYIACWNFGWGYVILEVQRQMYVVHLTIAIQ